MAVDDRTRLNLHRKLEAVLGPEEADTLMAHLPPVTWHDVATKDDLRAMEAGIRGDMESGLAGLRSELHTGLADVRTELRTGLADVRTELRTGLADVRTELSQATDRQTRWMVAFMSVWSTVVIAAARLLL